MYKAEFKIFNSAGEQTKSKEWTGELKAKSLNEAVINYFFGWQSTKKFMYINPSIAVLKANFQEEIDLTNTLSPL